VAVVGDIGNFTADFSTLEPGNTNEMGGLVAGQGGGQANGAATNAVGNGSISDVTATRIAAIIAGESNGVGLSATLNAVASLSMIKANVIGDDIFHDGTVQDTSRNTWTFADGTPLADGIVIAVAANISDVHTVIPGFENPV
jgi:hypothetical protein